MDSAVPAQATGNVGPALLVVQWVLLPISFVVLCLRFATKLVFVKRPLHLDDLFIALAFVVLLCFNISNQIGVHYGVGRHLFSLSDADREQTLKWIVITEPFAVLSSMFGRIGFAIYLLNLIGPTDHIQRGLLRAVMVLQVVFNVLVVIQLLGQCGKNISAMWDPAVEAIATCQSPLVETNIGYVQSSINSACDLILTVLPFMVVSQLHLSMRTKIGLAGLLCLSMFAFVASLIKAVSIKNLAVRNNFSYNMAFLSICCAIEDNLVIIGASIPTLKPLLKLVTGSSTKGSYGDNTGTKRTTQYKSGAGNTTHVKSTIGGQDPMVIQDVITRKTDVIVVLEERKEPEEDV
ncbi:hypothetical protein K461DRAFT_324883 [Myriangium duriaei CBS 260.36]|uniref:Rhodopsin domain-containing protein n=1 Tax=Myriangium duriaei CBS 260.36 TaxID=1168546 RepID=A0A9P4IVE4_9PEZI|nr:hypothetical protein K461DRAFT_324883 [Myriangium duriaei CBS 260.36]